MPVSPSLRVIQPALWARSLVMQMRILVTGASGYVGSALIPRLRSDGHHVRGYGRSAARVTAAVDEMVEGDAALGTGLDRALDGVETAYFLIHSMEGTGALKLEIVLLVLGAPADARARSSPGSCGGRSCRSTALFVLAGFALGEGGLEVLEFDAAVGLRARPRDRSR